jgi:lipopolysaccharide/colanic/teichoic acid biosynthesis glycosyltransferase
VNTLRRLAQRARGPFAENVIALFGAMTALGIATLWVGRIAGPVGVGNYAMLRILPWLVAVVISGGLAGSLAYFLSGPTRDRKDVPSTVVTIALLSGTAGALLWLVASPLLRTVFLRQVALGLVAWVALRVALRLFVITGKAAAQGVGDLRGSNVTIFLEELMFLPAYAVMQVVGLGGDAAVIGALLLADAATAALAWGRLLRRGFVRGASAPSFELARRMYGFGMRGQIGSLIQLLNLRFNFIFLGALAGPGALGLYAVAAKYAEFLRLVPIAANWVLYPRFARSDAAGAATTSRRMILRAGAVTATGAVPLALGAVLVIPALFGSAFRPAVLPAQILLVGLAAEGVGGVATAFLFGRGRPGLNSLAAGAGVTVTVALDVLLIPRYGAVGAAIASSIAYLTTTLCLVLWYRHVAGRPAPAEPIIPGLPSIAPDPVRRALDVAVALLGLVVLAPVMAVVLIGARLSTGGSAIYRQTRVGEGGRPFTMYKVRSMRTGQAGPEVTGPVDQRVTRMGAALRMTSLDEVPQLVNVLRGEMTLVGPRPETVALALRYPAEYQAVFAYRPGLTGPVHVQLQDAVPQGVDDVEAFYIAELLPYRTKIDLAYLKNPSLAATLGLIWQTVAYVISRVVSRVVWRSRRRAAAPVT